MIIITSEEYVNQVDRLISLQNVYLSIFLAVLAIILAFVGVLQWKLSTKQIEKIKDSIDQELDAKYNLQAIRNIENTTAAINKIVSHSIITLGKQVFSIGGPNYRSVLEFRGLVDPLYNFDEIEESLAIFLVNTINMILERFQGSEETIIGLNRDLKKMNRVNEEGLKVLSEDDEEDYYVEDKYFKDVKLMLLNILDIVKSKGSMEIKSKFDFDELENNIKNFKRDEG